MRVLVFGDSITQGSNDPRGGWVDRLKHHYLKESAGLINEVSFFNLGISADTSKLLLARMDNEIQVRKRPDMAIVIAIGLNDSWIENGNNLSTTDEFRDNFQSCLDIAKSYTDRIMIVGLSPVIEERTNPVSWADISYNNTRILEFQKIVSELCEHNGVTMVEVFNKLVEAQKTAEHFTDGLHPDENGHKLMFEIIQPELDKLLAK